MAILWRSAAVLTFALGCSSRSQARGPSAGIADSRPEARGPLAAIADSLLPRSRPQTCWSASKDLTLSQPSEHTTCLQTPDTAVAVAFDKDGKVTFVTVRMARRSDPISQIVARLTRAYGVPDTICGEVVHWETSTIDIDLNDGPPPYFPSLSYSLRGLKIDC
jgi:hypothetical protein